MKRLFCLAIAFILIIPSQSYAQKKEIMKGVDVYTFKKGRVDQGLEGNRGYLSGKPESVPSKKKSDERTLIGIDVELPSAWFSEEDTGVTGTDAGGKRADMTEEVASEETGVMTERDMEEPYAEDEQPAEEREESEEEWIK